MDDRHVIQHIPEPGVVAHAFFIIPGMTPGIGSIAYGIIIKLTERQSE